MGYKIIRIGRSFRHLISGEEHIPEKTQKPAFERQKTATKFRFKQTWCGKIVQLSSSNFTVKNFMD
jgi:hypothetical protein